MLFFIVMPWKTLFINNTSVINIHCDNDQFGIVDFDKQPVTPNPIAPEALEITDKCFSGGIRIICMDQVCLYPFIDCFLDRWIQFFELFVKFR